YFWLVETVSTRAWPARCSGFKAWTGLFAEGAFCRRWTPRAVSLSAEAARPGPAHRGRPPRAELLHHSPGLGGPGDRAGRRARRRRLLCISSSAFRTRSPTARTVPDLYRERAPRRLGDLVCPWALRGEGDRGAPPGHAPARLYRAGAVERGRPRTGGLCRS